jgi:hypothetical protein
MSFTASTVRRVLYEGGPARFLYAIGNTPARAVLPAGDTPIDGSVKVGTSSYCNTKGLYKACIWRA